MDALNTLMSDDEADMSEGSSEAAAPHGGAGYGAGRATGKYDTREDSHRHSVSQSLGALSSKTGAPGGGSGTPSVIGYGHVHGHGHVHGPPGGTHVHASYSWEAGDGEGGMIDEVSTNRMPHSFRGMEGDGDRDGYFSDDLGSLGLGGGLSFGAMGGGSEPHANEHAIRPRISENGINGMNGMDRISVEPMLSRELESSRLVFDLEPFAPMCESQARMLRGDDKRFLVANSIAYGIKRAYAGDAEYLFGHMNMFKIFDDNVHEDAKFTMNLISFAGNNPMAFTKVRILLWCPVIITSTPTYLSADLRHIYTCNAEHD